MALTHRPERRPCESSGSPRHVLLGRVCCTAGGLGGLQCHLPDSRAHRQPVSLGAGLSQVRFDHTGEEPMATRLPQDSLPGWPLQVVASPELGLWRDSLP